MRRRRRAHPRSRGENQLEELDDLARTGSSPLTRGKHTWRLPILSHHGLIPAHAGKTGPETISLRPARAHPRSRGENCFGVFLRARSQGSSPLTRGKHAVDESGGAGIGLIPAHAGKTGR